MTLVEITDKINTFLLEKIVSSVTKTDARRFASRLVRGFVDLYAWGRFDAKGALEAVETMHAHGPRTFQSMQRSLARCTALMKKTLTLPRP